MAKFCNVGYIVMMVLAVVLTSGVRENYRLVEEHTSAIITVCIIAGSSLYAATKG